MKERKILNSTAEPSAGQLPVPEFHRCILYGAGNLGKRLAGLLPSAGIRPLGFLDRNKTGECAGLPVATPENAPEAWKELPVLIAVFNPGAGCGLRRIAGALCGGGFHRIIAFEHFFQAHPELWPENYFWLTSPSFYCGCEDEIHAALDLFDDPFSRQLFQAEMRFRQGGSWEDIPDAAPVARQYFDPEICPKKHFRCFADIGAFTGDTLEVALGQGVRLDSGLAFEPDMANFRQLCAFLDAHSRELPGIVAIPAGVGKACCTISFSEGGGSSAKISESGPREVPIVSLDEVCPSMPIDFVKMDIEGAEADALSGMHRIIEKNLPVLAISVYHRPEDLFRIPLTLSRRYPGYRYALRLYGEHCLDTVLYALPPQRK